MRDLALRAAHRGGDGLAHRRWIEARTTMRSLGSWSCRRALDIRKCDRAAGAGAFDPLDIDAALRGQAARRRRYLQATRGSLWRSERGCRGEGRRSRH